MDDKSISKVLTHLALANTSLGGVDKGFQDLLDKLEQVLPELLKVLKGLSCLVEFLSKLK